MDTELKQLYDQDRKDHRAGFRTGTHDYAAMRQRDARRRQRVIELDQEKRIKSRRDFFFAAQVFQHGDTAADARRAYEYAQRSMQLGYPPARWLTAAAYDRWLMYQGKPQKYGTQYVSDGVRHRLWDVDAATSDEERAEFDVPPLQEQLLKAEAATQADPPEPINMQTAPQWLKDALGRWKNNH